MILSTRKDGYIFQDISRLFSYWEIPLQKHKLTVWMQYLSWTFSDLGYFKGYHPTSSLPALFPPLSWCQNLLFHLIRVQVAGEGFTILLETAAFYLIREAGLIFEQSHYFVSSSSPWENSVWPFLLGYSWCLHFWAQTDAKLNTKCSCQINILHVLLAQMGCRHKLRCFPGFYNCDPAHPFLVIPNVLGKLFSLPVQSSMEAKDVISTRCSEHWAVPKSTTTILFSLYRLNNPLLLLPGK